jgi:peptidyl-prolyl cis-trans isomerase A (cyclophilin A)
VRRLVLLLVLVVAAAGCGGGGSSSSASDSSPLLDPASLTAHAPGVYDATLHTSKGDVVISVHRAWAPRGADRFYNLVQNGFYDGERLFRVVPDFVVQFGISNDPTVSTAWADATISDDPVKEHNTRGTVTFATAGPETRTTQVFINLADNRQLDSQGFAPFGEVVSGMDVVGKLYSGYGEGPSSHQEEMTNQGDAYFQQAWPKLDTIEHANVSSS